MPLEIEILAHLQRSRVVPALQQIFHQPDLPPAVCRGLLQHLEKEGRRHEVAAGAGQQEAAALHHLHAAQIQLFVSPGRAVQRLLAFGKCRRIADDDAKSAAFVRILPGQVEDIGLGRLNFIRDAVCRGVAPHQCQGAGGDIHRFNMGRAVQGCVDRKAAGAAAQIQYILPRDIGPQVPPVFLLVEEVAGLLPSGDIDKHGRIMLPDLNFWGDTAVDAPADLCHAFLFPYGKVIPLIDPGGLKQLC